MFRNLQIRSKLVAILVLPLLTLMAFAATQVLAGVSGRAEADRLVRATRFASGVTVLADALQRERALSGGRVATNQPAGDKRMPAGPFLADTDLESFRRGVRALDTRGFSGRFLNDLATATERLDRLAALRASMDAHPLAAREVTRSYDGLLDSLLAVIGDVGAEDGGGRPGGDMAALTAVARAKEAVSQGQVLLLAALTAGRFTPADHQRFAALAGQEQAWLAQFRTAASADQRAFYAQTVAGGLVQQTESMRQAALAARDLPPGLAPVSWFLASSAKLNLLHRVELRIAADATAASAAARSAAFSGAALVSVAVLLVVGLAVSSSLLLSRSMARPLLALERTARQVAEQQLPGVVERLQQADETLDLAAAVDHIATAPPAGAGGEIGRLATAFSSVQRVAVRVAAEQAALRKSIGDMFVNLARRNQSLLDRQLNLIDQLERQTGDPERLDELFQLDHLATRMRRNAENLLVLAGAEPVRRWSEPVPLADVVRAAAAEVEQFARVQLSGGDGGVLLAGSATSDLVHLLAELVENAVAFSPPETPVRVTIRAAAGGYLVEIEDRGLGMRDEELAAANDRLANPPEIDFALSRMLGFFVVGRLAERHGVQVQLRSSWCGGVTALVLVPSALLLPSGAEDPHGPLTNDRTGRLQGRVTSAHHGLPPAPLPGGATAP